MDFWSSFLNTEAPFVEALFCNYALVSHDESFCWMYLQCWISLNY